MTCQDWIRDCYTAISRKYNDLQLHSVWGRGVSERKLEQEGVEKEQQRGNMGKGGVRAREIGGGSWGSRGRQEWMTSSVGTEGYFKNVIGRRLRHTPLGRRHR